MATTLTSRQLSGLLRLLFGLSGILYRLHLGWLLGDRFLMLIDDRRNKEDRMIFETVYHAPYSWVYFFSTAWGPAAGWSPSTDADARLAVDNGRCILQAAVHLVDTNIAAVLYLEYAHRHPLAFRAITRMLLGESLQTDFSTSARLAAAAPLLKLSCDTEPASNKS